MWAAEACVHRPPLLRQEADEQRGQTKPWGHGSRWFWSLILEGGAPSCPGPSAGPAAEPSPPHCSRSPPGSHSPSYAVRASAGPAASTGRPIRRLLNV